MQSQVRFSRVTKKVPEKYATIFWTKFLIFLSHKIQIFLIFDANMFGSQCGCASNQPPNSKLGKLVNGQAGGISGDVGLL